jgi:riboflavin synthase
VFTGLVSATARVLSAAPHGAGSLLVVERPATYADAKEGESISVSGVCLTVTPGEGSALAFDVSPETLRRTTLGRLQRGGRVNLERALAAGDRFGGHVVSGHVDATTSVKRVARTGDFVTFTFALEASWARYVVEKGSVALDGISLTVAELRSRELDVAVIPHTLSETTLSDRGPGDDVNVEVDMLAKYVERLLEARRGTDEDRRLARLLDTA